MSTIKIKILIPLLLLISACTISILLYMDRPENARKDSASKPITVEVELVKKQTVSIPVIAQGTVTPHTQTSLVAEVSGKIVTVAENFNAGGFFKAGELLIQIDDRDYRANLEGAKAAVASALSNLAQEKGSAEVARQDWLKFGGNIKRSQESTDLYLRKPQMAQAQARLESARADLQKAQDNLERTQIRAPYDSILRKKHSDIGQYVSPGHLIATTFAVDYAEVRLAIPQNKLGQLNLPDTINSNKDSNSEAADVDIFANIGGALYYWEAKLHRTEGTIDELSRVLFTVARVEDPYGFKVPVEMPLRIGTFVTAEITGKYIEDIIVLPRNVLRAGSYLWVVDKQRTLRNRQVETLKTQGSDIYITSGLKDGDLVCISIVGSVIAGTPVRIAGEIERLSKTSHSTKAAKFEQSPENESLNNDVQKAIETKTEEAKQKAA